MSMSHAPQALLMLVAFVLIASINASVRPMRSSAIGLSEYVSFCVSTLTIALLLLCGHEPRPKRHGEI
jgi:hypothetical protein